MKEKFILDYIISHRREKSLYYMIKELIESEELMLNDKLPNQRKIKKCGYSSAILKSTWEILMVNGYIKISKKGTFVDHKYHDIKIDKLIEDSDNVIKSISKNPIEWTTEVSDRIPPTELSKEFTLYEAMKNMYSNDPKVIDKFKDLGIQVSLNNKTDSISRAIVKLYERRENYKDVLEEELTNTLSQHVIDLIKVGYLANENEEYIKDKIFLALLNFPDMCAHITENWNIHEKYFLNPSIDFSNTKFRDCSDKEKNIYIIKKIFLKSFINKVYRKIEKELAFKRVLNKFGIEDEEAFKLFIQACKDKGIL